MLKFKLFYDKDEEEVWLNKMSQKGWAFKKFFLGFYTFEACEPNEYRYQIDLLGNWSGDKKDFASFMEESGVEVIDQWYRWVFIRKRTVDGPFEMYTDAASKIAQYNRIKNFFLLGLVIEIICLVMEISATVAAGSFVYIIFDAVLGLIALALLRMVWKCKWKIDQLKNDDSYYNNEGI